MESISLFIHLHFTCLCTWTCFVAFPSFICISNTFFALVLEYVYHLLSSPIVYLNIKGMVLNARIHLEEVVDYVLNVSHLWLIHLQSHCLLFVNVLLLCTLLMVGSNFEVVLQFPLEFICHDDYYIVLVVLFEFLLDRLS